MNDDKITDLFMKLTAQFAELNSNMKLMLGRIENHEQRLMAVEQKKGGDDNDNWKNQLLMLLAKAVVVGGVAITSLAGAGQLLKGLI